MLIFVGPPETDKTTPLLQLTYDYINKLNDLDSYAFFITSKTSPLLKELLFGRYDTVTKNTLEKIIIKYLEKYEDLILFFDNLLLINKENLPSFIAIDKINLFTNLSKFQNYKVDEIFIQKSYVRLSNIFESFGNGEGLKSNNNLKINIACTLDLEDLENTFKNDDLNITNTNNLVVEQIIKNREYNVMVFDLISLHFENIYEIVFKNNNNKIPVNGVITADFYEFKKCNFILNFSGLGLKLNIEKLNVINSEILINSLNDGNINIDIFKDNKKLEEEIISIGQKLNNFYISEADGDKENINE